jgi:hypothetical protein
METTITVRVQPLSADEFAKLLGALLEYQRG